MKPLYQITDDLKANVEIAKDQEEYETLPAHLFEKYGQVCCAIELDKDEWESVVEEGKIYLSFFTFGAPLNPFYITTDQETFKEFINQYQKDTDIN